MIQTRFSILRNKFFFLLGIILLIFIFFLCISTLQSNEANLQQKIEKLELQNEAFNKQIEVEKVEQQQRLSAERDLYERTKRELNQKIRDLKEIHDKENQDAAVRFSSLQQQYKILKTQHSDLDQDCEKVKKDLFTENDGLKSQLMKLQGQLTKVQSLKESDLTMWKAKNQDIANEKEKLENIIKSKVSSDEHQQLLQLKYKTYQLEQENKDLKQKLHIDEHERKPLPNKVPKTVDKSFHEQIPVSDDHYKIPIAAIAIRNKKMVGASNGVEKKHFNSLAQFQIVDQNQSQNVLQQPMPIDGKSSTTTTTTPTSVVAKKENLISPAKVQVTPIKTSARSRPLPKGILPIPDLKNDNIESSKNNLQEEHKNSLDETLNKPQNAEVDEEENVAHEEHDNDFNIEDKNPRSNLDDNFDDKNVVNNAAEEFDAHKPLDKKTRNEEMDLEIINRPGNGIKDKLNGEIAGDHGKEPDGYPEMEDIHMIDGQVEEGNDDLGDVGEYDDLKAIKQGGVAERN